MLGGTDVNVDAASSPARGGVARRGGGGRRGGFFALDGRRRAGGSLPATTVVVPQGVLLPTPREARRGQMFVDAPETFLSPEDSGAQSLFPSLHDALGVPSSTPVFLLPAGLRPVKDVLWVADAAEAAARRLAESRLCQSPGTPLAASASSPAFALAVVGPALDAARASLVSEEARACSPSAGGAGVRVGGPVRAVSRSSTCAPRPACHVRVRGAGGALLEAAAAARRCAGTSRGARCWFSEAARLVRPRTRALAQAMTCAWKTRKTRAERNISAPPRDLRSRRRRRVFGRDALAAPRLAACAHPCGTVRRRRRSRRPWRRWRTPSWDRRCGARGAAAALAPAARASRARRRGGATSRSLLGGGRYGAGAARAAPGAFGSASPSTVSRCDGRRANDSRESTRRPERGSVRAPSSDEATEHILCITAVPRCTAVGFSFRFGGPSGAPKAVFRGFARHDGMASVWTPDVTGFLRSSMAAAPYPHRSRRTLRRLRSRPCAPPFAAAAMRLALFLRILALLPPARAS